MVRVFGWLVLLGRSHASKDAARQLIGHSSMLLMKLPRAELNRQ
jgi:hypothetical protein